MIDLRPDVVYVVDAAVWRDFQGLREQWDTANCVGFHDECVWRTRQAIKSGEPELAAHWQKVKRLAEEYGVSWVSAVEVDGELIREEPKSPVLRYPEDSALKRITIGEARTWR